MGIKNVTRDSDILTILLVWSESMFPQVSLSQLGFLDHDKTVLVLEMLLQVRGNLLLKSLSLEVVELLFLQIRVLVKLESRLLPEPLRPLRVGAL